MKFTGLIVTLLFTAMAAISQCPPNINFSTGDLSNWTAYTGSFSNSPKQLIYPANTPAPAGTTGAVSINEITNSATGIAVNTINTNDPFGGFETVPTINGYGYNYSVTLGSTTVTPGGGRSGITRGIEYIVDVPAGLPTDPYIITYAYAMVLENGSHTTSSQPIFNATVTSPDGKINCASATYNLPTIFTGVINNNNGRTDSIYEVDIEIARQQGFTLSNTPSPNINNRPNESQIRVWTKGWTEVMFNLSQYRGKTVTINFEADNCLPGGHFAYAYIALRNECGGPKITGPSPGCINTNSTYSLPSLANGVYSWTIPAGWQIVNGNNTNIITVKPGNTGGTITATADNGCAKLDASLIVNLLPPTVAGNVTPDAFACSGNNNNIVTLKNNVGEIIKWVSSTNGITWIDIGNAKNNTYNAVNLTTTTQYRALIQNGKACSIDTSTAAIIKVFDKSVGGKVIPAETTVCLGQNQNAELKLSGNTGDVASWQWSDNGVTWNNFTPAINTISFNTINQPLGTKYYRAVVKVGVCPADTSAVAKVNKLNAVFPQATISPASSIICYGGKANLHTTILTGTSYLWGNTAALDDPNKNNIPLLPHSFTAVASPLINTQYPISVKNNGCPNAWNDTFRVQVLPPILPNAGNDTFIVAGQPLQLNVFTNFDAEFDFQWSPPTGLSKSTIQNPVATLSGIPETIIYKVLVTDIASGCAETASKKVTIFKTGPDVFVPNAFTPNNDRRNDALRPILVGISKLNYFKVYNRYGQLVFTSNTGEGNGWNGLLNGREQPVGVYVWVVNAVSYTGNTISKKGTALLVR